jgi:hypothetical protein
MSLLPAQPAAAGEWRGPEALAEHDSGSSAVIVTARDGSSVAVWSGADDGGQEFVYLRRITATGRLRPPVMVSEPGPFPATYKVAVDDDGDAVVVWQVHAEYPVQWQVLARRVSRTGELGPVVRVSDEAELSSQPSVAVTPFGVATIVFHRGAPTSVDATVVRRLGLDSSLSKPTYLPWSYITAQPVSSRSGHVAFVMSSSVDGTLAARVDPDGDIHVRRLAADLPGQDGPAAVDLDRRGNAYAVVSRADRSRAWVRVWRVGGRLEKARRVTPKGEEAIWVQLRTDLAGDTTVLWAEYRPNSSSYSLRARLWHADRLGPVARLGPMDGTEHQGIVLPSWTIDVDDDGDGVLAWEVWTYDPVDTIVRTQVVRRDGSFSRRPRDLGSGVLPVVAVAPGGVARLTMGHELWTRG